MPTPSARDRVSSSGRLLPPHGETHVHMFFPDPVRTQEAPGRLHLRAGMRTGQ